jgi:hypothetical protein
MAKIAIHSFLADACVVVIAGGVAQKPGGRETQLVWPTEAPWPVDTRPASADALLFLTQVGRILP